METHIPRAPNASYSGRNGFIQRFSELPDDADKHGIHNALENHRTAMFVIHHKKRAIPDFEVMKAQGEESNKLLTLKEILKNLRESHTEDLQRLYAIHAHEYKQEMLDRRLSNDETIPNNDASAKAQLQKLLYSGPFKDAAIEAQWQDDYEKLRYSYLSQLTALEKERQDYEVQQEKERKRREKMFPISIEDFEKKPKDIQLRAARFLVATEHDKEGMLAAFDWAWRQTTPLQEVFKKDQRFAADVRAMVLTDMSVTDPRRARVS